MVTLDDDWDELPKPPVAPTAEELVQYSLIVQRWADKMWRIHRRQKRDHAHFMAQFMPARPRGECP